MKNSMSVLDIYVWIAKWGKSYVGCFVNNVYLADSSGIILKLNCKGLVEKPLIIAEASRRIHTTSHVISEKGKQTPFLQVLRKRLRNTVLTSIEQLGWERVVKMTFERGKEKHNLYVEILPRGVIVLTDSEDNVVYASQFVKMKDRSITPKTKYVPPPLKSKNPFKTRTKELYDIFVQKKNIVKGLVNSLGIPGEIAEEIVFRAGIDKKTSTISLNDFEKLYEIFREIVDESLEGKGFIVKDSSGNYVSVLPFKPKHLVKEYIVEEYPNFNNALDRYFAELLKQLRVMEALKAKENEIARLKKSIEEAIEIKNDYIRKAKEYRRKGNLIMQNLNTITSIINCFRSKNVRKMNLQDAVRYCNENYGSLNVKVLEYLKDEGKIVLEINNEKVEVDIRVSPYENAAKYYEEAKEKMRKASRVDEKIEELKEKLNELLKEEEVVIEEEKAKIRRREWYERYHWSLSENGVLIIGGRDADQNESIVRKLLEPNDIFVHADIHGASAVIVKCRGKASEKALKEASVIAASYSKAWKQGLASVDVYWVWGTQVSKKPPAGEYLTKGAFMIYGKKNYIRNVPLRLALGLEEVNGSLRVIIGSEENVKRKAIGYVILTPGNKDPYRLAKEIKKIFYEKLPSNLKAKVKVMSENEIAMEIPGPSTIEKVVILKCS